ncbi:hypothetical protein Tco_1269485 [Tanacetum coccineum]
MSAMADTTPMIATVKNTSAKEKPSLGQARQALGTILKVETAPKSKTSSVASNNRMEILNLLDPTLDRSLLPVKDGE